jgi:uncharacterized protein
MRLTGPAAGHALMKTAADPAGTTVLDTLNNCAHGYTPWGTYLTCKENFIFYCSGPDKPGGFAANRELLDHGTLYVARFNGDNSGQWIEVAAGKNGLSADKGFADQGEMLVKARQASDLLGATKMDRPEWIAIDPRTGEVYCTLTNNTRRGAGKQPAVDAANPRANNSMGHFIKWKETGDFDAARFTWSHVVMAGDPANARAEAKGNIKGTAYGSPDGLWFDARGVLWIQTDAHATNMYKTEYAVVASNMMLAADVTTGETRRFLVGPVNCEITGVVCTPDMKTMFVNVQHPGESPSDRSDPANPSKFSTWPSGVAGTRPRSATVVIRKNDGGLIGT